MADRRRLSLPARARLWVLGAMSAGLGSAYVFMDSQQAWNDHLAVAYVSGLALHDTLATGAPAPDGVTVTAAGAEPALAPGWRETRLSLTSGGGRPDQPTGPRLSLRVQSPEIQYPTAGVAQFGGSSQAAGLASLIRTLASLCGDPVLFAQIGDGAWQRIDGAAVWACDAQPPDRRLWAAAILIGAMLVLLAHIDRTAQAFNGFAAALRDHRARNATLPEDGPDELREAAAAVNSYVAQDRAALANRALVLSGVSHDLGTPATRLRLRAALISDPDLRAKLERDIDQMTEMLDGALTYTRAEIGAEDFRELSLSALAEAVVDDYRDVGMPVRLLATSAPRPARAGTIFAPGHAVRADADPGRILMRGQPTSLRRALSNLIDNALKYGREAEVAITADADDAVLTVTDRGSVLTEADMDRLTGMFERGENVGAIPGVGLGLAIVSTIAAQHGGRLEFERGEVGLSARLVLCRRWA